jgi:uncharacterized protein YqhQ
MNPEMAFNAFLIDNFIFFQLTVKVIIYLLIGWLACGFMTSVVHLIFHISTTYRVMKTRQSIEAKFLHDESVKSPTKD